MVRHTQDETSELATLGHLRRGIPSISAMTFCNITKNQAEAALSQAPAIQTRNRRQAQTKKSTQNNPLEICLLEGGYPIFTSKSQGKYGLETGGGVSSFCDKKPTQIWVPATPRPRRGTLIFTSKKQGKNGSAFARLAPLSFCACFAVGCG